MDCNIRSKLNEILDEQIKRLVAFGIKTEEDVKFAKKELRKHRLLPDQLETDLCKELKLICLKKYEDSKPLSTRLDGFGWSVAHIQDHMERMLKTKLQEIFIILKSTESGNDDILKNS